MLPTFVIGLREGLEAALIVGIIAAFLRKQGRRDLLRWVAVGIAAAVLLCLGVGVALEVLSKNLPQRQQEGLETVIGVLAVAMVTYMVVWMRRHSRELKGQLEGLAAEAMHGRSGAGRAMVAMAFLAVLREGFETVVFLAAAFNESANTATAGGGAVVGILVAVALGYGIYRGGVHINLSKFFRATGLVLVLVAAGLVVNALRTAHEAGWLNVGQSRTLDLTWLVQPGSVQSSLLTGMLGIQPHPVLIEVLGWLLYLVPVGLYVAWPPGRSLPRRALARSLAAAGALAAIATAVLVVVLPERPPANPQTAAPGVSAQLRGHDAHSAVVYTQRQSPARQAIGAADEFALTATGSAVHAGTSTRVYAAHVRGTGADGLPATLSLQRVADLNGGRLPIGLRPGAAQTVPVRYEDSAVLTVWVATGTDKVVDLRWSERVTARVHSGGSAGELALGRPVAHGVWSLPRTTVQDAVGVAQQQLSTLDERAAVASAAWGCGIGAVALLVAAAGFFAAQRRSSGPRSGMTRLTGEVAVH